MHTVYRVYITPSKSQFLVMVSSLKIVLYTLLCDELLPFLCHNLYTYTFYIFTKVPEEATCLTSWDARSGQCVSYHDFKYFDFIPDFLQCLGLCKAQDDRSVDITNTNYGRCYCNNHQSPFTVACTGYSYYEVHCQSKCFTLIRNGILKYRYSKIC